MQNKIPCNYFFNTHVLISPIASSAIPVFDFISFFVCGFFLLLIFFDPLKQLILLVFQKVVFFHREFAK